MKAVFFLSLFPGFSSLSVTTFILTLAVVFVNGLTDAPNSVATCITTRCLKLKTAVLYSAFFNFTGVFTSSKINARVTETIVNMINFGNAQINDIALCAALFSIVLWAVIAWYFGIPTSESHALIAGLLGCSLCVNNGFKGIDPTEWIKTIYGLFTSCIGGFLLGFLACKAVLTIFRNINRGKANVIFKYSQIAASFFMSFMHGAQDGQKFIAVMLMCLANVSQSGVYTPLLLICSITMALGTAAGGKKIIKAIGIDMVRLEKYQGFSADLAAGIALLLSTFLGFPVSTTHAKTTAMMGAGYAKNRKSLNTAIIKDIALTWLLTFPGCAGISYIVTKVFLKIF